MVGLRVLIKLTLKLSEYEDLHEIADSRGKNVTVQRRLLLNLLMDHSTLLNELGRHGIRYTEPEEPKEEKPKFKLRIKKK